MTEPELPPPLEMACLCALWHLGEGNVGDVRRTARSDRPLAYTTVLTLLHRLGQRGAVIRRKDGRLYRYRAAVERDAIRARALELFLDRYFDGSAAELRGFMERPELTLAVRST